MFDIITEVFVTLCCLLDNVCGMGSSLEKSSFLVKKIYWNDVCVWRDVYPLVKTISNPI